ncbi:fkbM family methyltransferase isoform X2 [Tasmannia lanceolata]|uniref:fkbM family methyltransferase isoform X2 n=1 Tax=Tasmannia lanceolata TaxID=3420 RepID=UPI00406371EF
MANAWKRVKPSSLHSSYKLFLIFPIIIILILFFLFFKTQTPNLTNSSFLQTLTLTPSFPIQPFDCFKCPQPSPVFANTVEGVRYPFLYSLADLGLPEKPHKNIVRMLKGKPFRKPDISVTIQETLERFRSQGRDGFVVDVGANVGMATFAASAMGFRVFAFEPVFENLQRICDGVFLNRVASLVTLFAAVASDRIGNITFHKLVGRLDNSAVSESGAKLAFKSNEGIALQVGNTMY